MRYLLIMLTFISLLAFQLREPFDIADYFGIKAQKHDDHGKESIRINPIIKNQTQDSIGQFINRYPKRFNYLLTNRTDLRSELTRYEEMYPDTVKISQAFARHLQQCDSFLLYVNTFLTPIQNPSQQSTIIYSKDELMEVASKFFFCDRVRPDSTIGVHVCIGLNGVKEAHWAKDYTLLEAFCFEAIFENLLNDTQEDDRFMKNVAMYRDNASDVHRSQTKTLDDYLEEVKLVVFEKMKYDETLKEELLKHFQENKENLPFEIQ
ncbi:MAG: hypothetical protein AAF944_11145 [Bacteroidota bacterium]